jgi:prevent-host-death family protein
MLVNILEAKTQLSQLIRSAQAGEDVVIANRGEPVVRLVPVGPVAQTSRWLASNATPAPPTRRGGFLKWLETNPLPKHLERSAAEIDAAIDEERSAWD